MAQEHEIWILLGLQQHLCKMCNLVLWNRTTSGVCEHLLCGYWLATLVVHIKFAHRSCFSDAMQNKQSTLYTTYTNYSLQSALTVNIFLLPKKKREITMGIFLSSCYGIWFKWPFILTWNLVRWHCHQSLCCVLIGAVAF